ncbi:MAG: HAD family hydrolase [Halobacteriales archaeon]
MYDAIVFDNDGILTEITDEDVFRRAIRDAFDAFGVADPRAGHVEALLGVSESDIFRVCEAHGIDPEPFWRRRDDEAARRQKAAIRRGEKPLYPDAEAALDVGVDVGVVSNNQQETVRYILDWFGLEHLVDTYYGREHSVAGVRRKKPGTYYIERALDDLDAEKALYVGDSEKDVVAAQAAGIDSAFVRRPHRADVDLDPVPTYEVPDLRELREVLEADGKVPPTEGAPDRQV